MSVPISVQVRVKQSRGDEKNISIDVICPHSTGGHGHRCKAAHLDRDKIGIDINCPYVTDIPYVFDNMKKGEKMNSEYRVYSFDRTEPGKVIIYACNGEKHLIVRTEFKKDSIFVLNGWCDGSCGGPKGPNHETVRYHALLASLPE